MKEVSERTSRLTRQSSGNRQSCRSSSGLSNRRSLSASENRSSSANEQVVATRKRKSEVEDATLAKRSNSSMHDVVPKVRNRIIGGKKIDAYCWICHKPVDDDDDEFCCLEYNCRRVYHKKCHKKIKTNPSEPLCLCKWTSVDRIKSQLTNSSDLKEILNSVLEKVIHEKNNKKTQTGNQYLQNLNIWPIMPENDLLCIKRDIKIIVDLVHSCCHTNTGQFFQDIKWIYHNCYITRGPDHEMTIIAQKFEKAIKQQLTDAEACGECYLKKISKYPTIDFFTKICPLLHPVVWAKLKGFPFWPAKCLRVVNGHADVRFFGTHDKSLVPLAQVYKMSRRNPGGNPKKSKNSSRMTSYEEAMIELSHYISNYEIFTKRSFNYYPEKTPLEGVKKSGKKTHQSMDRNQLDAFMNTNGNGFSDTSNNQSPHLNVSVLHDDAFETKAALRSSTVVMENLSDSVTESNLVYDMTFCEETPGEMNIVDEVVGSSSSIPQLPETCSQNSITSIKNCPQFSIDPSSQLLLNDTETTQIDTDSHTIVSDNFPSIPSTSTSPPFLITSTQSLRDRLPDAVNELSKGNITNSGFLSGEHINRLMEDMVNDPALSAMGASGDDDDIEVVNETRVKTTAESILKSKALIKTLSELLLGNRPNLRNHLMEIQKIVLHYFLLMWLEINSAKLDITELRKFHGLYYKINKKVVKVKIQNIRLMEENADLRKKLEAKERKTSLKEKIIQSHYRTNIENAVLCKREAKKLQKDLDEMKDSNKRLDKELEEMKNANKRLNKKLEEMQNSNKMLNKELDEVKFSFAISTSNHQNEVSRLSSLLKKNDEKLIEGEKEFEQKMKLFSEQLKELEKEKTRMFEEKKVFEEQKKKFKKQIEVLEEEKESFNERKKELAENNEKFGKEIDNYQKIVTDLKDKDTEIRRLKKIISEKKSDVETDVHCQADNSYEGNLHATSAANMVTTHQHQESHSVQEKHSVQYKLLQCPQSIFMPNPNLVISSAVNASPFTSASVIQGASIYPFASLNTSSHTTQRAVSLESSASHVSKSVSANATYKQSPSHRNLKRTVEVSKEVKKSVLKNNTRKRK